MTVPSRPRLPSRPSYRLRRQVEAELVRRQSARGYESLREFMELAWYQLEPETRFLTNWHVEAMAEYLQAVTEGHIQNLIINVPPRSMKSIGVCVLWPTWEWIRKPGMRYIFSSFSEDNMVRDANYARKLIGSRWFQERWGWAFQIGPVNRQDRIETYQGGFRILHGIGGGVTGEGGQRLVVDDPHELDDDMRPTKLRGVREWWDTVMPTRVNDPHTAARVIVQQRIHDKDLTGHLQDAMKEGGRHYEQLVLPAEYERKHHQFFGARSRKTGEMWYPKVHENVLPDHLRHQHMKNGVKPGSKVELKEDPRVRDGDLLWPERMPRAELDAIKVELGRKASGQLQQRPVPSEGDLFKQRFFHYWTFADPHNRFVSLHLDDEERIIPFDGFVFTTVDLATSLAQSADETAISTWMWTSTKHLLWISCEHGKMEGPDIIPAVRRNMVRAGAQIAGIEKSGFQLSIIQQARREGMAVIPLTPDGDKRNRAIPAAVMMDGQQIFLPGREPAHGQPFTADAENQLLKFTGSPNDDDDVVDTLSYAVWVVLNRLQTVEQQNRRNWGGKPDAKEEPVEGQKKSRWGSRLRDTR